MTEHSAMDKWRKLKNNVNTLCYTIVFFLFVILVPPTAYTIAFCTRLEDLWSMWNNTLDLWNRVVLFALLLCCFIIGALMLLFKIEECESR